MLQKGTRCDETKYNIHRKILNIISCYTDLPWYSTQLQPSSSTTPILVAGTTDDTQVASVSITTAAVKGDEPGLCEANPFSSSTASLDTTGSTAENIDPDLITPEQEDQLLQPQPGDTEDVIVVEEDTEEEVENPNAIPPSIRVDKYSTCDVKDIMMFTLSDLRQ